MFNLETREFVNFKSYEKQNTVKRVTIFTYVINRYITMKMRRLLPNFAS